MKLLDKITIERPKDCNSCYFGYRDPDEGFMCCGSKIDYYTIQDSKGRSKFEFIESPQEAFDNKCDCMFVGDTND